MKPMLIPRWLLGLALMLGVAVATSVLTLWAAPRLIMHKAMQAVGGDSPPKPVLPPMTNHTQRRIVMPSPDLLYATCVWDVSQRPLRIKADLRGLPYASIALYAANSDNFWVINDRQLGDAPLDLWLIGPQAYPAAVKLPEGARTVAAPTTKGLLLMRTLVSDLPADVAAAQVARQTLRCDPV